MKDETGESDALVREYGDSLKELKTWRVDVTSRDNRHGRTFGSRYYVEARSKELAGLAARLRWNTEWKGEQVTWLSYQAETIGEQLELL